MPQSQDLATALAEARARSALIYFARVDTLGRSVGMKFSAVRTWLSGARPGEYDDLAEVTVLEVFKGSLKIGSRVEVPSGGGADCTLDLRAGQYLLVYSRSGDPTSVSRCGRTQVIDPASFELTSLRSGLTTVPDAGSP